MIAWSAVAWAAPLLLDAGGAGTAVLEGFDRLDPSGCDDPRVAWVTPPTLASWQGAPDPLAADFVQGGVLHLHLDPGRWVFHVMVGRESGHFQFPVAPGTAFGVKVGGAVAWSDEIPAGHAFLDSAAYAASPFPVFRPGETAWDRQVALQHVWRTFPVEVPEGGVDVEVFGAPLQGLVAVPEAEAAEGEVLLAVADAHRRAWWHDRVDTAASTWTWPFPAGGPLRATVGTWRDLPDPDGATAIERAVAPDERVGFVVWLFPGDGAAEVTVEGLDALALDLFEVHPLDASGHTLRDARPRPAFLRPTDGDLRGGQGFPVGIAAVGRVPADATGLFEGRVVARRGEEAVEVPVRLRVRALDLAPAPVPVGLFADLRQPLTLAYGSGAPEVWAAYDRDLAMMRERDLSVLGVRFASPWPARWPVGKPPDTALFAEAARRWRASGGGPLVWLDAVPWSLDVAYANPARPLDPGLGPTLRGLGEAAVAWDAALYTYDEASLRGFEMVDRAAAIAALARAEVPAVRLAAGELHPVGWSLADPYDVLLIGPLTWPSSSQVASIRAAGASPWLYNQTPGRASAGLLPFLTGADAVITWHWAEPVGDPFHDAHPRRQWQYAILAPGGDATWPTPLLESFAEGVTDQRYLATLDALVAEAEARRGRVALAAEPGRALLDVVRALDGQPSSGPFDGEAWSEADLDRLRGAAGDAAEALSACLARRAACPRVRR